MSLLLFFFERLYIVSQLRGLKIAVQREYQSSEAFWIALKND